MGFSVGRFAKIWKLEDKTTYTPVSDLSEADLKGKQIVNKDGVDCVVTSCYATANLSVSKRDKDSGTYKVEFKDGFVAIVGKAYQLLKDAVIDENHGLTVKILNCDVTNMYTNAYGKVSYTPHYTIYDAEFPNFDGDDAPTPTKKKKKSEEKVDDFVNIADGIGDEELPFN